MGLLHGNLGGGSLVDEFGETKEDDPFRNPWPNTPDFTFNYKHLLQLGSSAPIGSVSAAEANKNIVIIGAGVSGLLAARELFRCGYKNIDIIEATGRIGGRNFSQMPYGRPPGTNDRYTPYEMGAMRFPLFGGNSVMGYFFGIFSIDTSIFPDPGIANTGIWINQGRGVKDKYPDPTKPYMYIWKGEPGGSAPPADFKDVFDKWITFKTMFIKNIQPKYADAKGWPGHWQKIVDNYRDKTFLDVALLDAVPESELKDDGYYGGLGMNAEQARLFYTIGAGDGSWGAFFAISALYPMRTLLFGFGENHQQALGRFDIVTHEFLGGNHFAEPVQDSLFYEFDGPTYVGIQSLPETLFYEALPTETGGSNKSLYDRLNRTSTQEGIRLFLNTEVTAIAANGRKKNVAYKTTGKDQESLNYDIVITTPTTWATQTSYRSIFKELPTDVWDAFHTSHWITSCKVFFPLEKAYWTEQNAVIPQIIVSDTQLQDSYGYVNPHFKNDRGVFLASYTWEDDALKFIADDDRDLSNRILGFLREITTNATTVGADIGEYLKTDDPNETVFHWTREPSYRGCAKLYRPGSEFENYTLLSFNQNYGKKYGIYVNGEAASVYGGWTEPALRHALDTVINIVNDGDGEFKRGFSYQDNYPIYPDNPYT